MSLNNGCVLLGNDHLALRDFDLASQLFIPQDLRVLNSMRSLTNKCPEEHCTEVFNHWNYWLLHNMAQLPILKFKSDLKHYNHVI